MNKDPHRYDNLIFNKRPTARIPMDAIKRAAQFAPFAALTGYGDQIEETARLTDDEIYLTETEIAILDLKLKYLNARIMDRPVVTITYYAKDSELHAGSKKSGGEFVLVEGIIKKIDTYNRCVIMSDEHRIAIGRIVDIKGEILESLEMQ